MSVKRGTHRRRSVGPCHPERSERSTRRTGSRPGERILRSLENSGRLVPRAGPARCFHGPWVSPRLMTTALRVTPPWRSRSHASRFTLHVSRLKGAARMAQAGRVKVEIGRAVAEPPVEEAEREALAVPAAARPTMLGGVRRRPPGMFDALQVRDFRLLWIGMIISNAGSWMQMIGQGWLVLQLTNSPFWLGMVAFARAVPVLAFSLFAGAVADRVDRRRLLLVTQSTAGVLALLLAVLTSTGVVRVWEIMAIAFLSATTMAFDNPSRQALVPDMVGRDRLMNAVGLNSAAWNGAAVIGPSLAGVAIGVVGVAGCFYLNAASFLAVVWALWAMRARG